MANAQPIQTPLGSFASINAAAAAHHCDKSTVQARLESDPEQYKLLPRLVRSTEAEWGTAWNRYRAQSEDQKEAQYLTWCSRHKLDPDLEDTANQFMDYLDPEAAV